MKFIDVWNKIENKTGSIEEFCNGKFIEFHTCFCLSDAEEETHLFLLMGSGESNTTVDINQEIKIKNNAIVCKDTNDNKLELYFHKWEPIDLMKIEP